MTGKARPGNALGHIRNIADGHALAAKGYAPRSLDSVPHTQPLRTSQPNLLAASLRPTPRCLFVYQSYI
jgi:hypothetical protein